MGVGEGVEPGNFLRQNWGEPLASMRRFKKKKFLNGYRIGKLIFHMQLALLDNDKNFEQFKQEAESFMCRILPNSPYSTTQYTQGNYLHLFF